MLEFTRKDRKLVYDSKVVSLYNDYLITPDGKEVVYDFIKHKSGGGAGILLVDDEECTYLVKQYRNSIDRVNMEIPAGAYSREGESGETCALREGEEETGLLAERIFHVSRSVSAIGTFDETTDIYIGLDIKKGHTSYDQLEYIDVVRLPVEEAIEAVYSGDIVDSKTVIALLAYKDMKSRGIF